MRFKQFRGEWRYGHDAPTRWRTGKRHRAAAEKVYPLMRRGGQQDCMGAGSGSTKGSLSGGL